MLNQKFSVYFGGQSIIRCDLYKYFLPVGLVFTFSSPLFLQKFFYFSEVQIYTLSPVDLAFSLVSKMSSPYPRICRFFPNVTSSISIVLHFTFRSLTHLECFFVRLFVCFVGFFLYFIYLFISCAVSLLLCGLFSSCAE